ncbi:MAG: response regulator [Gammaproteobacteria bacterium]|nr:response regulator [Gammaproteobacteria bacterium]
MHDRKVDDDLSRERFSRLCAAMLRISGSLDVNTVLQEVVDSARALTGASYGMIATVDERGRPQDFITSGLTVGEHREFAGRSDGPRLFEHLRRLPAPVKIADVPAYLRSHGYAAELFDSKAFLGMPMHHRGVHVGSFFLAAEQAGTPFSHEDEEILKLFALQAAAAFANARTHRDERRARADLEALVEMSPVGVVVFDADTGVPVSFNREAKRIVSTLSAPGEPPEQLLDAITFRRADGREIALDEFPIAGQLGTGEMVRAEEIVLSVPDGRSVTALINATPIRDAEGVIVSVVVTLQDLAALRELETQRAEFLATVSHELRAPLTSVKGSTAALLGSVRPLDHAEMRLLFRIIDEQADRMQALIGDLLDAGRIRAGTLTVAPAPTDLAGLVDEARNTFISGGGAHAVRMDLPQDLPRVMADEARVVQVLNNLIGNAARHSPSSSPIRIDAEADGIHVAVSVSDEGAGVAPDRLPLLFRGPVGEPGVQRRGLGLVICKGLVEAHGGRIRAESAGPGQGTRFTFTLPSVPDADAAATTASADSSGTRMRGGRARVLVLDDDPETLRLVRDALAAAGYDTVVTGDPRDLPRLLSAEQPDLVLLDLVLPGADGIDLMDRVPELAEVPVIFISGYDRAETIATAFDAGAADYIVKPFSPTELTARVRAALRRRESPGTFSLGQLAIRHDERRVTLGGRELSLTPKEYTLLRVLSLNAGRVMTHDALLRRVWDEPSTSDRVLVRTVVRKLRAKLGDDAARPTYIFNERGVGYRMPRYAPSDA